MTIEQLIKLVGEQLRLALWVCVDAAVWLRQKVMHMPVIYLASAVAAFLLWAWIANFVEERRRRRLEQQHHRRERQP
jgi:hypothetical protein